MEKNPPRNPDKMECREVFLHSMIDLTPLRIEVEKNKDLLKDLPVKTVNIAEVVPTQNEIYISNLERTKNIGNETGAYLVFRGGRYFIFDGPS